ELAVHEPDVGGPVEGVPVAVRARAAPPIADADETVEVGDQRGVASPVIDDLGRADGIVGSREVEVKESETVYLRAARDWARASVLEGRRVCERGARYGRSGDESREAACGRAEKLPS